MAAAKAKAVETEGQATDTVDPRAAALAALTGGAADPVAVPEAVAPVDLATAEDFGGDKLAVVLTTRYNGKPNGTFKQARKGAVVKVYDYELNRGVEIGALRDLGK